MARIVAKKGLYLVRNSFSNQSTRPKSIVYKLLFHFFLVLHICLVIFISFISYTTVHLSISCTKVQIIHSVIHFHLIHFTDHSPSHLHSQDLVSLTMHRIYRIPNSLYLSLFSQSRLWKLGVSIDKNFKLKYILYHLRLNSDDITTFCYFKIITTFTN